MHSVPAAHPRHAKVIDISTRVRWDIDADLIRGRRFDTGRPFMPAGLSLIDELGYLGADERRGARIQEALAPLTCAVPLNPTSALPMAA